MRALGLKPGPEFARILASLRDAWLDGKLSSADEEALLLDRLVKGRAPEQ
ncbi:MAG: hypothetical protein IPO29_03035 [Anaerolineae bacterium]|nr:hypothetical protein [Anaerolineae bacterium]